MDSRATTINMSIHVSPEATKFKIEHHARKLDHAEDSWVVKFYVDSWPHGQQEFNWFGTKEQMLELYNNMMASFDEGPTYD